MELYEQLLYYMKNGQAAVLATVLDGPYIGKRRLWSGAETIGTLGEPWLDERTKCLVAYLEANANWVRCKLEVPDRSGMAYTVMLESFFPPEELIIFGGGHLSQALVKIGVMLEYKVIVADDRPAFANRQMFPQADVILCDDFSSIIAKLSLGKWSNVVIMTRGHRHDVTILEKIIKKDLSYIGMIGSKRRTVIIKDYFQEQGIALEKISRVHMPIGLAIGARTPAEIAVSISAELIQERYRKVEANLFNTLQQDDIVLIDGGKVDYISQETIIILSQIKKCMSLNEKAVLATIIETKGSTPRKAGAKMLILSDGRTIGTIGGGCVEGEIRREAYSIKEENKAKVVTYVLDNDVAAQEGMVCGGRMEILLSAVG
ncbi:MAG: adhP [Firmicutes bacterium]|nr:adhP [Bacillota bacterium]